MRLTQLPVLLTLFSSWTLVLGDKEPRQSAVFTATNQFVDSPSSESSHTIYDTLSAKRPGSSGPEYGVQQGKQLSGSSYSNSFSSAGDSSGGFSNSYSAPPVAPAYVPQSNRPVQIQGGYQDRPIQGGYQDPVSTIRPFQPDVGGYPSKPSSSYGQQPQYQQKPEESYAYYYQHYPGQAHSHQQGPSQSYGTGSTGISGLWQGEGDGGSDLFGGFSDLGGLGGAGGAGLAGIKGLGVLGLAALAKGFLAIKPLLIIGGLLLLTLPLLILFLPIPIITLAPPAAGGRAGRAGPGISAALSSAMTTLSEKVLNSEECLERVLCKMPVVVPTKFQTQAKSLWTEYGPKFVKQPRVQRGLTAYFDNTETKHRAFKCNQKFKCTNKFF